MATFKPRVSLAVLPKDVITLKDDQFYDLVEHLSSNDVSRILRIQCINSVNTFLLCKNILQSILLPTSAFDDLREDVCLRLDHNNNNTHVIHVGIIGQIEYLTELFRKKHFEEAKTIPKRRSTPNSISLPTHRLSTFTTASGGPLDSTLSDGNATRNRSSTFDYRSHIVSSVNKWVNSERKSSGSSSLTLVEGVNYTIETASSADTIIVVCQCDTRISFSRSAGNALSLSNLYKHWKNSKRCNVLVSATSDRQSPASSSPSVNDSLTNDDDKCDNQESDSEDGNDDGEGSNKSNRSSIRPNTRSSNKRASLNFHSAIHQPSSKRRR